MNDTIIPRPIPFADTTEGELELASELSGVSVARIEEEDDIRVNPVGVAKRFLEPMGRVVISLRNLDEVAAKAAVAGTLAELRSLLKGLESAVLTEDGSILTKSGKPGGTVFLRAITAFRTWLEDPVNRPPPFTIWAKGNSKLPFWCFSALPGITCPGAGDCLTDPKDKNKRGWCYSFAAWRNVFPYFRQLQNTLLLRLPDKSPIEREARRRLKPGQVVRLYVDGDFDSRETLDYWMHFCGRFPENKFYGYSKSWGFFKTWHRDNGGRWPENYQLNLSSGTMLERVLPPEKFKETVREMMALKNPETGLPVVRGTFRALAVDSSYPPPRKRELERKKRSKGGTLDKWNAHRNDLLAKARELGISGDSKGAGVFVCPGLCATCLPGGRHACGDRKFQDITIVIGIH